MSVYNPLLKYTLSGIGPPLACISLSADFSRKVVFMELKQREYIYCKWGVHKTPIAVKLVPHFPIPKHLSFIEGAPIFTKGSPILSEKVGSQFTCDTLHKECFHEFQHTFKLLFSLATVSPLLRKDRTPNWDCDSISVGMVVGDA